MTDEPDEVIPLKIRIAELENQLRNSEVFRRRDQGRISVLENDVRYYQGGADDLIDRNEKMCLAFGALISRINTFVRGEISIGELLAQGVIAAGTLPQPETVEVDAPVVLWFCPEEGSYEHRVKADRGPTVEWRRHLSEDDEPGKLTPVCLVCGREGDPR